ncbi:hypothetical protein Tco_0653075 [Tanacetum coccineum]|uniref:Uncharacterized protein n=1 Tax=Tanacetum coccineum TaxID=301880 RepID=A0ABQ4X048_9ASTR
MQFKGTPIRIDHNGYDALDIKDQGETMAVDKGYESSVAYCSSDDEDLSYVDFHTEVNDNAVIKTITTNDQFLNKLGSNSEASRCDGYNTIKKAKKELVGDKEQKQGKNKRFKVNKVTTKSRAKTGECTSKSPQTLMKAITSGKGCFESPKWTKAKIASERVKPVYGLRLYASWMSSENSFQIKSLKPEHILDDEETSSGNNYFRRINMCVKGVKDGWLAGCRKVIRLDGCFLKHTCRGELLVSMGMDANNQMYPIAWAVMKVETLITGLEKNRVKAQFENNSQVSRVGRRMTYTNCQEKGHKKSSCQKELVPKPPKVNKTLVPKPPNYGTYASARGGGRGSRGGRCGIVGRDETSESSATMGEGNDSAGQRGRVGGRAERGKGRVREAEEGAREAREWVKTKG